MGAFWHPLDCDELISIHWMIERKGVIVTLPRISGGYPNGRLLSAGCLALPDRDTVKWGDYNHTEGENWRDWRSSHDSPPQFTPEYAA